jgi:protoporphyrinogen oxidase
MKTKTAVIIGAGPAGLTAAYELLTRTDIKPVVVEMESQVGGLSRTIDYKGNKIDIGGHRFFSKSEEVLNWWLSFLPLDPTISGDRFTVSYHNKNAVIKPNQNVTAVDEEKIMLVRPRKSRIYYNKRFFDYPLQLNIETARKLGGRKMLRIVSSYIKARLFPEKPEHNLARFFKNRFGKELYHTFFKDYTEKVWGVSCEKIPADWGRQRVKDLNIGKVLLHSIRSLFSRDNNYRQQNTSTSLIQQFLYPKYGPGQMWAAVATEIERLGGSILLNTEVSEIHSQIPGLIATCKVRNLHTGETGELKADYFISTMPIQQLLERLKGVTIPAHITEIAAGLEYRDFLIVGLLASQASGKKGAGELTDNWIYIQEKKIKAGRLQLFHNWSPFMVADPGTAWLGVEYFCNETDAFWQQSDEKIIAQAIQEMSFIDILDPGKILDAVVIRVKKAYPSYYGTYNRFDELRTFLDTFDNLFEVGRNGMHKYNNSDHSMLTAMKMVDNIISGRKDRSNIWNVNTEEDYHEE